MDWPESISGSACSAHYCTRNRNNDEIYDPDCNAFMEL